LALAALALVVFGAYNSYPMDLKNQPGGNGIFTQPVEKNYPRTKEINENEIEINN